MRLYKKFGTPAQDLKVYSNEELINIVNKFNGVCNCYSSLYWYNEDLNEYIIDKVYIDIDDNDYKSTDKIIKYLLENNLKFQIFNSGGGHAIYIASTNGDASNIRIFQNTLVEKTGATVDPHNFGDVVRISRIPNTWNFNSHSFCVPIKIEEIEKIFFQQQRFEKFIYGNKILNLLEYTEDKCDWIKPTIINNLKINSKIPLLPCIRKIIQTRNPRHDERFLLAVYLSYALRKGKTILYFNSKDIEDKILEFMNENCNIWIDWNLKKTKYYIHNIIPSFDIAVNCKFIKEKGCCIGCKMMKN